MATNQAELVKALIDAGVHFGHRVSRWCPKMEPYIHGKRNNIHIIDIKETVKGILRAKKLIQATVASGKDVLFVGTKRQARFAVEEESKRCNMHYVSERWLGGTLTNFRTIRQRLNRLEELEKLFTTGQIETYSKKMKSTLQREMTKIKTNLDGIRRMNHIPGVMVLIDTRREHIAVKEAKRTGVKTIALIDTDSDPDLIDLPIPANDDAMRAIELILKELAEAAIDGKVGRTETREEGAAAAGPRGGRRSSRSQFKAESSDKPTDDAAPASPAAAPTGESAQV